MKYDKKDWKRSDGQYNTMGKEDKNKEKRLTAYQPADREKSKEERPNEMMTMESSYGGISFGANRKRKMTMVVHEKRSSHGPGLKNDNKQVEGSSKRLVGRLRGKLYANSHDREDSAFSYEESLETSQQKMMNHLKEMLHKTHQKSGEQVIPFLNQKEDKEHQKEIMEQLRTNREKGNREETMFWEREQETLKQELAQKERMYHQFYKELEFSKEKAKKLMKEDVVQPLAFFEEVLQEQEDGTEEEPNEQNVHEGGTI